MQDQQEAQVPLDQLVIQVRPDLLVLLSQVKWATQARLVLPGIPVHAGRKAIQVLRALLVERVSPAQPGPRRSCSRLRLLIRTFSVGFREQAYSELDHARAVARQFGTDHSELVVEPEAFFAHWPLAVLRRGAPVSESAMPSSVTA